jgi:SAM-dependent methyltransferase
MTFTKFVNLLNIFNTRSKLGGNLGATNLDLKPLQYFKNNLGFNSFLDIGCGTGGMVFNAINSGLHARGIEGDPNSIPKDCPIIECVDYRTGSSNLTSNFDIGWSVEFLEHVPSSFEKNYFKDFSLCNNILITAAPPGWGGDGHVNEQSEEHWIHKFSENNFTIDWKQTQKVRSISEITFNNTVRQEKKQFVRNRGLFFKKTKASD